MGVVNVETEVAYALSAEQTMASADLPHDVTRLDQALFHLEIVRPQLPQDVEYLAVDGAYAKEPFVTGALHLDLHISSKLRSDANLRYLYTGVQKSRGRPRKYDGKVDFQDLSCLSWVETVEPGLDLYTALVWSVALKRELRLVYLLNTQDSKQPRYVLLFSTDIHQTALEIYSLYSLRFQIEFLFRNPSSSRVFRIAKPETCPSSISISMLASALSISRESKRSSSTSAMQPSFSQWQV